MKCPRCFQAIWWDGKTYVSGDRLEPVVHDDVCPQKWKKPDLGTAEDGPSRERRTIGEAGLRALLNVMGKKKPK